MLTNKEKKANDILKILEKLYPKTPIPLSHKDPYTLLVAVVLSAQCTDERVNKITPLLFKEANNPKKMVKLGVRNIEKTSKTNLFSQSYFFYLMIQALLNRCLLIFL